MLATASAQVCVPLGHSSLYFCYVSYYLSNQFMSNKILLLQQRSLDIEGLCSEFSASEIIPLGGQSLWLVHK